MSGAQMAHFLKQVGGGSELAGIGVFTVLDGSLGSGRHWLLVLQCMLFIVLVNGAIASLWTTYKIMNTLSLQAMWFEVR